MIATEKKNDCLDFVQSQDYGQLAHQDSYSSGRTPSYIAFMQAPESSASTIWIICRESRLSLWDTENLHFHCRNSGLLSILSTTTVAGVAQLVERQLPKLNVASSNLVSRYAGVAQW